MTNCKNKNYTLSYIAQKPEDKEYTFKGLRRTTNITTRHTKELGRGQVQRIGNRHHRKQRTKTNLSKSGGRQVQGHRQV